MVEAVELEQLRAENERLKAALIKLALAYQHQSGIAATTCLFHVTGLRWREVLPVS